MVVFSVFRRARLRGIEQNEVAIRSPVYRRSVGVRRKQQRPEYESEVCAS